MLSPALLDPKLFKSDSPWWLRTQRLLPYAFVAVCALLLLSLGTKFWDANDDEHMAMLAHGYGIADQAGPGIVYSNVIWGWLIQHLGAPFGIQGYTLATYALLLASLAAMSWTAFKKAVPGFTAAAVLLAMFGRALLQPQFSVTAGYATLAGVALLFTLETRRDWATAAAACLLLLLGSLVRLQEALFVLFVCAPFLGGHLYQRYRTPAWRPLLFALLVALTLIGTAKLVDRTYYSGPEWQQFETLHKLRRPFTDYGMDQYFIQSPQLLQHSGFSLNDMQMLDTWFFLDDKVYTPERLQALLDSVPLRARLSYNFDRYPALLRPLSNPQVDLLLLVALTAIFFTRKRPFALAGLLLFLCSMMLFLLMGRPGVTRVFPGACGALALLILLDHRGGKSWPALLTGVALLGLTCYDVGDFFHAHAVQRYSIAAAKGEFCPLAQQGVQVVWGEPASLPGRYLYDPMAPPGGRCPLRLYQIGVLELLPENLRQLHAATGGKDLVPALLGGQALTFLTTDSRIDLLKEYFREHYAATLVAEPMLVQGYVEQYRVRVEPKH